MYWFLRDQCSLAHTDFSVISVV